MLYHLLSASTRVGTVTLEASPLSAGWLSPSPDYYWLLRNRLIEACATIRLAGFREDAPSVASALRALADCQAVLTLMTENGGLVEPIRIELWGEGRPRERPFVLVDFGTSAATESRDQQPRSTDGPGSEDPVA